jgi:hypothetical protein
MDHKTKTTEAQATRWPRREHNPKRIEAVRKLWEQFKRDGLNSPEGIRAEAEYCAFVESEREAE